MENFPSLALPHSAFTKATFTILLPLCPTRASALLVATLRLAENWEFAAIVEVGRGGNRLALPPALPLKEEGKKEGKEWKTPKAELSSSSQQGKVEDAGAGRGGRQG